MDQTPEAASAGTPQVVAGFRQIFPNYFPPRGEELRSFYTSGLVVLDANALLDAYRFNTLARKEFLGTLRLLADRLWIPHRVAQEFLENRSTVIHDRVSSEQKLAKDLEGLFDRIDELILTFLKDRGVVRPKSDQSAMFTSQARARILDHLKRSHALDIDADQALIDDPILRSLEQVIAGKFGPSFDDEQMVAAQKEAERRIKQKVPPGYADADTKDLSKASGDYFLWEQTLLEVEKRGVPVLIVSNDQKEDWIRKDKQKRRIGPRPELVQEVYDRTGQRFHLVTVQTFLIHAKDYLEAEVSDSTVEQAQRIEHPTYPLPANMTHWRDYSKILLVLLSREQRGESLKIGDILTDSRLTDVTMPTLGYTLYRLRKQGFITWDGSPNDVNTSNEVTLGPFHNYRTRRRSEILGELNLDDPKFYQMGDETDL